MVFERTENEPEEYDPEADFHDPRSDSITIPDATPDATGATADISSELEMTFWILVGVLKVAIFAFSLGAMFLVFEGNRPLGVPLLGAGLVLFLLAGRRYREATASTDRADSEAETVSTDSDQRNLSRDEIVHEPADEGGHEYERKRADENETNDADRP